MFPLIKWDVIPSLIESNARDVLKLTNQLFEIDFMYFCAIVGEVT